VRSYERGQLLVLPEHHLAALTLRQRPAQQALEQAFDAWGPEARAFHLGLNSRPVKTSVHVRRLLNLAQLYGRTEVLAAITRALALASYDAAYVENLLLEVLATLIGMEQTVRQQRALERRRRQARLPKQKTLAGYDFAFPKRVPKTALVRLFDCDFIPRHGCAVLIGPTGTGKTHLLTALGYTVCERGYSVCYTRVVDMLNHLTTAQINGRLAKALKTYVRPQVLLLDELGYLPIDKRGADLLFQVVAARYESGSIVLTTNRIFREWGTLFDVDNTLATALIDRLMHHGEALVIKGDSYRMKDKPSDSASA